MGDRDRSTREDDIRERERQWSNSRPNTFMVSNIDPRSVFPTYPYAPGGEDDDD